MAAPLWSRTLALTTKRLLARPRCSTTAAQATPSPSPPPCGLTSQPLSHKVSIEETIAWRAHAIQKAQTACDAAVTAEDFRRELDWLLEDAIDGWKDAAALASSPFMAMPTATSRLTVAELDEMWKRRVDERVPLQYLTNEAHWGDFVLEVGPGVLIPRPETEELARLCVAAVKRERALLDGPWCDAGTGSGALALALCAERRRLYAEQEDVTSDPRVFATDVSEDAAGFAHRNARRLGLSECNDGNGDSSTPAVHVLVGPWLAPLPAVVREGKLALLVSNPPYIPLHGDASTLQLEVGRHEPMLALDGGGADGADAIRALTKEAVDALRSGGLYALETNAGEQAHELADMMRSDDNTWRDVSVECDLEGRNRFVLAWRR